MPSAFFDIAMRIPGGGSSATQGTTSHGLHRSPARRSALMRLTCQGSVNRSTHRPMVKNAKVNRYQSPSSHLAQVEVVHAEDT